MSKINRVELKVVGVTFDGRQEVIKSMANMECNVVIKREPGNIYDRNAVAVYLSKDDINNPSHNPKLEQVGYIGKQYAQLIAPMMDGGIMFNAILSDIGCYEGTWYVKVMISEV